MTPPNDVQQIPTIFPLYLDIVEGTYRHLANWFSSFSDLAPACGWNMAYLEGNEFHAKSICADTSVFREENLDTVLKSARKEVIAYKILCKLENGGLFKSIMVRGDEAKKLTAAYNKDESKIIDGKNVCGFMSEEAKLTDGMENFSKSDDKNRPVVDISWDKANRLCGAQGKRLPTRIELYALARAEKKYDGFEEDSISAQNSPVTFGYYGMGGNVWEWISDWKTPYKPSLQEDKGWWLALGENGLKVLRGAAYENYGPGWDQSATVYGQIPQYGNFFIGFRCVSSPFK